MKAMRNLHNSENSISDLDSNPSTGDDSPILFSNNYRNFSENSDSFLKKENKTDSKYKTELCKTYSEKGFCPYGFKCRFAHGKNELIQKKVNCKLYKQKECHSFFSNHYCNYGSRCHFKHDERTVQEINIDYFNNILNYVSLISSNKILLMTEGELKNYFMESTPYCIRTYVSRFF